MSVSTTKALALSAFAFIGGLALANLPSAFAASAAQPDLSGRPFTVFMAEVKQNLVFGEEFKGSYTKSVTLSDGSKREIELTPMIHDGMQVVRLKDTGGVTYMDLNGTTTNGALMVQVRDKDASRAALKAQGWKQ